jgi:hypothetical protein
MSHVTLPATKLHVGARAVVGCGRPEANTIRTGPGKTYSRMGSAEVGSIVQILDKPSGATTYPIEDESAGFRWWLVKTERGLEGWTTEIGPKSDSDKSVDYYLDPVSRPANCPGALQSRLETGQSARVITTTKDPLKLRTEPGTKLPSDPGLKKDTRLRLVCHRCVGTMVWWYVVVSSGTYKARMGWVSEGAEISGDPDTYYLELVK